VVGRISLSIEGEIRPTGLTNQRTVPRFGYCSTVEAEPDEDWQAPSRSLAWRYSGVEPLKRGCLLKRVLGTEGVRG
jgi:hypothetical protein